METGRSKPSRELVLHLAEHLEVPLRERNVLLLAAGYAPAYTETPLDAEVMAPARAALDAVLSGHHPFPAVDRRRALGPHVGQRARARAPHRGRRTRGCCEPPINAMRVSLHPDGLAPRIANLAEYGGHLLTRVQRQAVLSGDPRAGRARDRDGRLPRRGRRVLAWRRSRPTCSSCRCACARAADELSFFSTLASFGTALDITLAELAIEAFFPADDATRTALRRRFD